MEIRELAKAVDGIAENLHTRSENFKLWFGNLWRKLREHLVAEEVQRTMGLFDNLGDEL